MVFQSVLKMVSIPQVDESYCKEWTDVIDWNIDACDKLAEAFEKADQEGHCVKLKAHGEYYPVYQPHKEYIKKLLRMPQYDGDTNFEGPGPNDIVIHIR